MKKYPIALLCGIATILVTVILYFVIFKDTVLELIHFLTLGGIVLAEIITTVYAVLSKGNPRKVAAAFISAFMIPISVWLSIVYLVNFPDGYFTYVALYTVALILVNVVALVIVFFDLGRNNENVRLQAGKENMRQMRNMVLMLASNSAAKPYESRLRALEENLRFSNDAVIAQEDQRICQLLAQLQNSLNGPSTDVEMMLTELEQTVERRAIANRYSH